MLSCRTSSRSSASSLWCWRTVSSSPPNSRLSVCVILNSTASSPKTIVAPNSRATSCKTSPIISARPNSESLSPASASVGSANLSSPACSNPYCAPSTSNPNASNTASRLPSASRCLRFYKSSSANSARNGSPSKKLCPPPSTSRARSTGSTSPFIPSTGP